MHRSITFSEMLSSTFSNDRHFEDDSAKKIFISRLGIGLIEVFTSALFFSYGIIFSEYVNNGTYTKEEGLWTTILYSSIWNFASPWSKNIIYYELISRPNIFKYVVSVSTVCLSIGVLLPGQILFYGIFGGFFSNLINVQLKQMALDYFQTDIKIFEGNIQCARAFSLLITPHLILFLVKSCSMEQVKYILAGLLLNVIPAVFIIKLPKILEKNDAVTSELSRYQTLPGLSHQMQEMVEFSNVFFTCDLNHNDQIPTVEEPEVYVNNDNNINITYEIPQNEDNMENLSGRNFSLQDYFSKAGVTILPGIPEEVEEENGDIIDSKRLSKISAMLEELNQQEENKREVEVLDINNLLLKNKKEDCDVIQNIEYIPNYKNDNYFDKISLKSCCCCTPSTRYYLRRKFRFIKDYFYDFFVKPFTDLYFYPIVVSKFSTVVITTFYFTLLPHVALGKNDDFKKDDTAFLLSYVAFSWCLFLVLLPLVLTFSKRKIRLTYICGLLISGSSMILLHKSKVSNDFIILNCLFFGFGHGMISYTENTVYKNFLGLRKWKRLEGSSHTVCAALVAITYFIIYKYNLDFVNLLPLAALITYSSNAFIWIVLPIAQGIVESFKYDYSKSIDLDQEFF